MNSTMKACISNATVTASGGNKNYNGGLTGGCSTTTFVHSTWNSDLTTDGVVYFADGSLDSSSSGFTTVAGLNGKLSTINAGVTDRTYEWQANTSSDGYPVLVKKVN